MLHGLHQKHVSTEQLDVVGDLDLEARFSSPGGVVNEKEAFSSGSTPHPQVGPATLSHDDPESEFDSQNVFRPAFYPDIRPALCH